MAKGFYIVKEWDNTEVVAFINNITKTHCRVTYTDGNLALTHTIKEARELILRDALQSEINI